MRGKVKITVKSHPQSIVLFNGKDVSSDCFEAGSWFGFGYVRLFAKNDKGNRYVVNGKIVTHTQWGRVKMFPCRTSDERAMAQHNLLAGIE